jgi:hypothetical protein
VGHKKFPNKAVPVGETVRKGRGGGVEKEPGRFDAAAREHHHVRCQPVLTSVGVRVDDTCCPAAGVSLDPESGGIRANLDQTLGLAAPYVDEVY